MGESLEPRVGSRARAGHPCGVDGEMPVAACGEDLVSLEALWRQAVTEAVPLLSTHGVGRELMMSSTGADETTFREHDLAQVRAVSFPIAYRMLGTVAEAEDLVQEVSLRVFRAIERGERIAALRGYVATVTTRLAINELASARRRREQYVGEWLPAPILNDGDDDPAERAELADSVSLALLVVLESLSAQERAAWLLRDVFGYAYREIATIIETSEDNVRQLASRARRHIEARRPRFETSLEQRRQLTGRFLAAAQNGDLAGLEALLANDVVLTGDGGGKVPALARSLHGRRCVARMLLRWRHVLDRLPSFALRPVEVNCGPGVVVLDDQRRLVSVWALEIAGGEIRAVSSIVNPDKLAHLGPLADFAALTSGHRRAASPGVGRQPTADR